MAKRQIKFFELECGIDEEDGLGWNFPSEEVHTKLRALSHERREMGKRTFPLTAWPDTSPDGDQDDKFRIQFGKIRNGALPRSYDGQSLQKLKVKSLAEVSHAVFFPNNVLGLMIDPHGPNYGLVQAYLRWLFIQLDLNYDAKDVFVVPLLKKNFWAELKRQQVLTEVDVTLLPSREEARKEVKGKLTTVANKLATDWGAKQIKLTLKAEDLRHKDPEGLKGNLFQRLRTAFKEGTLDKVRAKGPDENGTGRHFKLELNREYIVGEREVTIIEGTQAAEDSSAYSAIIAEYNARSGDIESALAAQIDALDDDDEFEDR